MGMIKTLNVELSYYIVSVKKFSWIKQHLRLTLNTSILDNITYNALILKEVKHTCNEIENNATATYTQTRYNIEKISFYIDTEANHTRTSEMQTGVQTIPPLR